MRNRLLALALTLLCSACLTGGGGTPHPQPPPPVFNEAAARSVCGQIWQAELLRPIDPSGLTGCVTEFRHGASKEQIEANVRKSEEYRVVHAPKPPARAGVVHADNHVLFDAAGPHLFVGATVMWAQHGFVADRDRYAANIDWLAKRGVDYVRILATVGTASDAFWACCRIDSTAADYPVTLASLIDFNYAHGLRTQITVFGDTLSFTSVAARAMFVDTVVKVVASRMEKVFAIEIANEGYNNFPNADEERALARYVMGKLPNLVAVTAPTDDSCEAQQKWYTSGIGTLVTLHLNRSWNGDGGPWRPMRQPWRESRFSCPGVTGAYSSNEPIGIASSVQGDDDPQRRGSLAATTFISGIGADVFHTGSGVRGIDDPARHRPPNIFDNPTADASLGAITGVRSHLAPDVPNWQRTSSTGGPFTVDFNAVDRVYCAWSGADFACSAIRIHAPAKLTAKQNVSFNAYDTRDGRLLQHVTLTTGQSFTLAPDVPGVLLYTR